MSLTYAKISTREDLSAEIWGLLISSLPRDPLFVLLGESNFRRVLYPKITAVNSCFFAHDSETSRIVGFISTGRSISFSSLALDLRLSSVSQMVRNYFRSWHNFSLITSAAFFLVLLKCSRIRRSGTELTWIAVDLNYLKRGIGTGLVKESGILFQSSWVKTLDSSNGAKKFYEKFGYVVQFKLFGRLIMTRELPDK